MERQRKEGERKCVIYLDEKLNGEERKGKGREKEQGDWGNGEGRLRNE